jgi:hypothetical protein
MRMACSLTRSGAHFTGTIDANVTVRVVANSTSVVKATYHGVDLNASNNVATFKVIQGTARLVLSLAGPPDDVSIVEDCGGGNTQELFGYQGEFHPSVRLQIIGKQVQS